MAPAHWVAIACLHALCWRGVWADTALQCGEGEVPMHFQEYGEDRCHPCEGGSVPYQWTSTLQGAQGGYTVDFGPFCVCPPGSYAQSTSSDRVERRMKDRPEGFTHAVACTQCLPGTFCRGGLTKTYLEGDTHAMGQPCRSCSIGFGNHIDELGHDGDFPMDGCPGLGASKDSQCTPCAEGYFSDRESATEGCKRCRVFYECPPGTFFDSDDEGKYCKSVRDTQCTECPLGKYKDRSGDLSTTGCVPCPGGTYTRRTGATSCLRCQEPNGRVAYSGGVAQYCLCSAGSYIDEDTGECGLCPGGTFSQNTRAHAEPCTRCVGTSFAPQQGARTCTGCQDGVPNEQGDRCVCDPGFYNGDIFTSEDAPRVLQRARIEPLIDQLQGVQECNRCPPGAWCTGTQEEEIGLCQEIVDPYIASLGRVWDGALDTYSAGGAVGPYSEGNPSTCRLCKAGHHMGGKPGIFCEPAPPGSFVPEPFGSADPTMCPPGTFQPEAGQTACSSCNATGVSTAFSPDRGRTECDTCVPGYHVPPDGASCEMCPVGHMCPDGGPKRPCNAGHYQGMEGQTECRPCSETVSGYTPNDGLAYEECLWCQPGSFVVPFGSTRRMECLACRPGFACSGTTDLRPCFGGLYSPQAGLSECVRCPPGTISYTTYTISQFLQGQASCHACPPGTFADDTRTHCVPCLSGTFCPDGSAVLPCAGGYFSTLHGQDSCTACDDGTYTPRVPEGVDEAIQEQWLRAVRAGHTRCIPCADPGFFVEEQEPPYTTCSPCTPGYSCAQGGRSPCHGGYFSPGIMAHECERCPLNAFTPLDGVGKTECTTCPADRPVQSEAGDGCVARGAGTMSSSGTSLSQGSGTSGLGQGWWACGTVVGLQEAVDREYPSAVCAIPRLREADASYSSVLRNDTERYGRGLLDPTVALQGAAWAPGNILISEPYVQLDLGQERPILALLVRGRSTSLGGGAFVTELRLMGSRDGISWRVIQDALPGSTDAGSVHFQLLHGTREQRLARFVRAIPVQFSGDGHWPHMSAALALDRS